MDSNLNENILDVHAGAISEAGDLRRPAKRLSFWILVVVILNTLFILGDFILYVISSRLMNVGIMHKIAAFVQISGSLVATIYLYRSHRSLQKIGSHDQNEQIRIYSNALASSFMAVSVEWMLIILIYIGQFLITGKII